jgi:hypothetical protein
MVTEMLPVTDDLVEKKAELTSDEKLHIRTLELEVYKVQAQYKDVESSFRGAVDALNNAIKQAGEKLGYDLKEYRIDLKTLDFVRANADTK